MVEWVVKGLVYQKRCWITSLYLFSLRKKMILVASENYSWTPDVTWTVLLIYFATFLDVGTLVVLLSMKGQRALGLHQKYLNLCSEDEQRSYGFGMTWGWVINYIIFILGKLSLRKMMHIPENQFNWMKYNSLFTANKMYSLDIYSNFIKNCPSTRLSVYFGPDK